MSEDVYKIDADVDGGVVLQAWVEKLKNLPGRLEVYLKKFAMFGEAEIRTRILDYLEEESILAGLRGAL